MNLHQAEVVFGAMDRLKSIVLGTHVCIPMCVALKMP